MRAVRHILICILAIGAMKGLSAQEVLVSDSALAAPFSGTLTYRIEWTGEAAKGIKPYLPDSAVMHVNWPWVRIDYLGSEAPDSMQSYLVYNAAQNQTYMVRSDGAKAWRAKPHGSMEATGTSRGLRGFFDYMASGRAIDTEEASYYIWSAKELRLHDIPPDSAEGSKPVMFAEALGGCLPLEVKSTIRKTGPTSLMTIQEIKPGTPDASLFILPDADAVFDERSHLHHGFGKYPDKE